MVAMFESVNNGIAGIVKLQEDAAAYINSPWLAGRPRLGDILVQLPPDIFHDLPMTGFKQRHVNIKQLGYIVMSVRPYV